MKLKLPTCVFVLRLVDVVNTYNTTSQLRPTLLLLLPQESSFPWADPVGGAGAILGVRTSPPFEGPPINVTHMKTPHFSNAVSPPVILYPPQFCMSVSLSSPMSYVKLKKLPCRLQGDKGFFQWGGGGNPMFAVCKLRVEDH